MPHPLLNATVHRPYPLPEGPWIYYQEWNRVIFLHWQADAAKLKELLPPGLEPDLLDGLPWISYVYFDMQRIRPRFTPALVPVSNFYEANVRTYVTRDGKPGVYFLSMEGSGKLAVTLARAISGLPYRYAQMQRQPGFVSLDSAAHHFDLTYKTGDIIAPTATDQWLTERYCLYYEHGKHLARYDIHHQAWPLQSLEITDMHQQYDWLHDLILPGTLQARYSPGVQVLAWKRQYV